MPPKLTPSSSDGSSTASSPSRYAERTAAPSGYTSSTLRTQFTTHSPSSSSRRRARGDDSILRGAALVRENLISRTIKTDSNVGISSRKSSFDSDGWSDPWTREHQEAMNSAQEEFSTSVKGDEFLSQPSLDGEIHWASMALLHRDNAKVDKRSTQQRATQRVASPFGLADFSECPPPPPRHAPPGSPTPSQDGTHVTTMGRDGSLSLKIVTYHVQPIHEIGDDTTYDGTYDGSYDTTFEELSVPEKTKDAHIRSLSSPLSKQCELMQRDPAFRHAQDAGYLWQSLVGHHVRFPTHWFEGLRAPPMGADAPWQYLAKHSVQNNPIFNHMVATRAAPGRLLLHFIVRDLMTGMTIFDLAIGCFHPNARGVRSMKRPEPKDENSRHVWMAIRKVTGAVSLMDGMLCRGRKLEDVAKDSPLGDSRRSVTNLNMRAVFGEEPPVHTICIQESELYERLQSVAALDPSSARAPTLLILQEFLVLS